ncbi:uncharacterized protein LOC134197559 [Corticium candelabrum]|uniref:uncharacterized protein LOC134197559 n=1 Tax=Corticium candelabrum TaxID=121492 RepID=UPI002E252692|nr:uncharacterized protein LOC134197559 [Corticium candelabrum]XP_062522889.1 uncharacterized protein LOC134197559 [Corticium candelabrum]
MATIPLMEGDGDVEDPSVFIDDGNDSPDKGDEDDVEMARVCRADRTCQFGNDIIASSPDNDNDDIETISDTLSLADGDGIDFSEERCVEMDKVSTYRTYQ